MQVSELFIHPVKSLSGISVTEALVTERGFQHDRRWMLIDKQNMFITQREHAGLALLQVNIEENSLLVQHKHSGKSIHIPFEYEKKETVHVTVWDDTCHAETISDEIDAWFSEILGFTCRLVYMSDDVRREVDKSYAYHNEITSFADGYPFLLIGQSSLDHLNTMLEYPLTIQRFRPNIVFTGGIPHEEDIINHFRINDIDFYGVKLCARCVITTVNPETGVKGKEPLRTLATYRMTGNKILFGQNLLHKGTGVIRVGDIIQIQSKQG